MLLSFSEIQKINDLGKGWGFLKVIYTFSHHHLVMVGHIFPMIMVCTIIYMQRGVEFLEKQRVQKMSCFIGLCLTLFIKLPFNMSWKIVLRTAMAANCI